LFTGFLADGKEHQSGNQRADDWRFWLPLICLFSGARIGEVAQLHVADVYRDQGIWCVELRDDEQTGQRTKSGKSRVVALHSMLLKIGLLAFVERQKKRSQADGNPQLFPEMKPGPRGQYGDEPSDWWRDYLAHIGVKSPKAGDGFGSHSFRHTMADQLRAAGHLDQVFGPLILGHSTKSVTGGYGETRQGTPQLSQAMIESVKFVPIERGKIVEGGQPVDFSHLVIS
jgi:integrase